MSKLYSTKLRIQGPASCTAGGFTLIETLVYITLVLVIAAVSVSMLLSLGNVVQQYQAEQALLRSNTNILERMMLDIRAARSVHTTASVFDDPTGVLVLTLPSEQVTYRLVDGSVERVDASGTIELQGKGVVIESFTLDLVAGSRSELVFVDITSAVATKSGTTTRHYTAGAVTRASYD